MTFVTIVVLYDRHNHHSRRDTCSRCDAVATAISMLVRRGGILLCGWPHANGLVWIVSWGRIVRMYRVNSIV